jgi:phosphodiesterase/alkaline phosphatase D-like protein
MIRSTQSRWFSNTLLGAVSTTTGHAIAALPNGIASGDIGQTSAVLWARCDTLGALTFQVATDAAFGNIVQSFTTTVGDAAVPVKQAITGLSAGTRYYYRVSDAGSAALDGTFATVAGSGVRSALRFGVTGEWRGELAPYPAINNAPARNLDFMVKLGDTIYAERYSGPQVGQVAATLTEYRARHDEVLTTRQGPNSWANLRRVTPIYAQIDDHEVINDFSGGAPVGSGFYNDTQRYRDGLQAFREYMPIRNLYYAGTGSARFDGKPDLYRVQNFGSTASLFITDARSFRDVPFTTPAQIWDPTRTMLVSAQLQRLKDDLLAAEQAGITWKFVMVPEPIQNLGPVGAGDRFEGYAAKRNALLSYVHANGIDNVVFVAADIHGTLVNNLTYQTNPAGAQISTRAWEVTTGAVAFDAPFGPTVVELAAGLGLLTPAQVAFYETLPPMGKDQFLKSLLNSQLASFGYSPIGLEDSSIPFAGLAASDYSIATHTYGWTEFEIDPQTQVLRVTTYGIPGYTYEQIQAMDPAAIAALAPVVVSQYEVAAVPEPHEYALSLSGLALISAAVRRSRRRARRPVRG